MVYIYIYLIVVDLIDRVLIQGKGQLNIFSVKAGFYLEFVLKYNYFKQSTDYTLLNHYRFKH